MISALAVEAAWLLGGFHHNTIEMHGDVELWLQDSLIGDCTVVDVLGENWENSLRSKGSGRGIMIGSDKTLACS